MTKKKETFDEVLEAKRVTNIYYKLSKVKAEIGVLSKNAKNPFFKSDYLDLNGILSAVEPLMEKHGLLLLQPLMDGKVITQIFDVDSYASAQSEMILPNIVDPQKLGSAITYFRRYTLQSLLALQAVDDDGNHASKPAPKKKEELDSLRFNDAIDAIEQKKVKKSYVINNYDLSVEQLAFLEGVN
jgi:hypothetical protein